ncbi:DUF4293 domain-containing protein [Flavobacterium cucumis]|uniref:Transcription termination factor Rho n=1 Tax=Flavobacterium cucumis TaxID=416016 RepID=A0A1M7ZYA8_9FLAO|nr:DUF4293 domain-containing protein [Flavobacterium cucumis]SHO73856.1 protein of unknown function [Flavobacterium cucumis]
MLQRIQTVYMAISAIVMGALPFVFSLWTTVDKKEVFFTASLFHIIMFVVSALLAIYSILNFKKRQNQFVLNRLNMIFNFILLGFFVYRSLNLSGETSVSEKGIGMFLPAISIVLLVLANKAIKKDEDLVKSVDRLR